MRQRFLVPEEVTRASLPYRLLRWRRGTFHQVHEQEELFLPEHLRLRLHLQLSNPQRAIQQAWRIIPTPVFPTSDRYLFLHPISPVLPYNLS